MHGSGFGVRVHGSGFGMLDVWFRAEGFDVGCMIQGVGFRI